MKYIKREFHGMAGTKIHNVWKCMKARCTNPNNKSYKNYGGRGITVCEAWMLSFLAYYLFVSKLENFGKEGYTLDRIKNDKGYYPGNVKYSTWSEQASNKRTYGISQYKGVSWRKDRNKWRSYIDISGKRIHLGYFNTELEAHQSVQNKLKYA